MEKRILVVGGCGYLGSIMSDMLSRIARVDVYDKFFFDNKDVLDEIKSVKHVEKFTPSDYDLIVWSATPDNPIFYEKMEKYAKKMINVFEACCKRSKVLNCSHWLLNDEEWVSENELVAKYFKHIEEKSKISIRVPELYGPSPRMRWDTIPNMYTYSAIAQDFIVVEDNWLKPIPLCSVFDFAKFMFEVSKKFVFKSGLEPSKSIHGYTLSKIAIATLIKHVLSNENQPIEIHTVGDPKIEYLQGKYTQIPIEHTLETSLAMIKKQLEGGMLPDFMKDKYNNASTFESISVGLRFLENLGE